MNKLQLANTSLQTERLLIRPFTLDDAEAFWPLVSLPEMLRYTGEQAQTSLEDVRNFLLKRPLREYATYGFGRMACIEKSTGRLIGHCGLKYLEDMQEVDIGYRFLPDCWGKGYATESAQALVRQGMEHGITRIIGLVDPQNIASAKVLKKLGLQFEGMVLPKGCDTEYELYATPGTVSKM